MIRLGTRGSQLATTQSETIAARLREMGHDVELVIIRTTGDRTRGSLTNLKELGVFAAELRTALLHGDCDLAVHSAKDLPVAPVPGLELVAFPAREDSRDVLCARDGLSLAELPAGARVGTGSPRRAAQLRALRPDLVFVDIRGNIGTRLARVAPGDLDAVVLAAAGLNRLGASAPITDHLNLLPSPGQGSLAVECRSDSPLRDVLSQLDDAPTRAAVEAERRVLAELGGGCAAPIGVQGIFRDGRVTVRAGVFAVDGSRSLIREFSGATADEAGREAARLLLADGAARITDIQASRASRLPEFHDDLWSRQRPLEQARILIAREPSSLGEALAANGIEVTSHPFQRRRVLEVTGGIPDADWVALTSPRTVETIRELGWQIPDGARVAAVGDGTRRAAREAGIRVDLVPEGSSSAATLLEAWPDGSGSVAIPGSALSSGELADGLRGRGWNVTVLPIYTMDQLDELPSELEQQWHAGHFDAIILCSGSGARAFAHLLGPHPGTQVIALGPPTAHTLHDMGIDATVAPTQDADGLLSAVTTALSKENPA